MPPDGKQGQLNQAVDGLLQRLVGRRLSALVDTQPKIPS
jgi:hypothetical protein